MKVSNMLLINLT